MSRAKVVADRLVAKVFSGRRAGNVEAHLSRDDVRDIAEGVYGIGYADGKKAAAKPSSPGERRLAAAGAAQDEAILGLARWVSEYEAELRDALMRDTPDLADELHGLLGAWRDAGTAIRDAAIEAAK